MGLLPLVPVPQTPRLLLPQALNLFTLCSFALASVLWVCSLVSFSFLCSWGLRDLRRPERASIFLVLISLQGPGLRELNPGH